LKFFLTQFGSILPLTSDPPVIRFWKWIGSKDYEVPKNRNLNSVSGKNEKIFSPVACVPVPFTHRGPPDALASCLSKENDSVSLFSIVPPAALPSALLLASDDQGSRAPLLTPTAHPHSVSAPPTIARPPRRPIARPRPHCQRHPPRHRCRPTPPPSPRLRRPRRPCPRPCPRHPP
jgi:hypothetical protein